MKTVLTLNSIKQIEKQYNTGELPVLVVCSDKKSYICKYMRSSSAAYKLASEFIGSQMIEEWGIESPSLALVQIKNIHWTNNIVTTCNLSAPAIGYLKLEGVIDITPTTCNVVTQTDRLLIQLLKIALFDFWIANEDRTYNNANLLYDIQNSNLVSIDYGGILNTSTFEYPLSQLTTTDTILYADIFRHLSHNVRNQTIQKYASNLRSYYDESIVKCRMKFSTIAEMIPSEWNISSTVINSKLNQLVDTEWIENVWDNFIECLNENLSNE